MNDVFGQIIVCILVLLFVLDVRRRLRCGLPMWPVYVELLGAMLAAGITALIVS